MSDHLKYFTEHLPATFGLCRHQQGITASIAAGAVGYGEGMGCCAAMTTRTAA
jgi:hypothetical protein